MADEQEPRVKRAKRIVLEVDADRQAPEGSAHSHAPEVVDTAPPAGEDAHLTEESDRESDSTVAAISCMSSPQIVQKQRFRGICRFAVLKNAPVPKNHQRQYAIFFVAP